VDRFSVPGTCRVVVWLVAPVLAVGLGCSSQREAMPKTYPVTGTVSAKGGQAVAGGSVHFAPTGDPTFSAAGDIEEDGTFTLSTVKGKDKVSGAPVGEYRVTASLPAPPGGGTILPVTLPQTYRVQAQDNHFRIVVPPQPVRPPRK
jgi:hypothetical protein